MIRYYAGWRCYDRGPGSHSVTGRFFAVKWGVRIGTTTEEGLIRMIDLRERDPWSRRLL